VTLATNCQALSLFSESRSNRFFPVSALALEETAPLAYVARRFNWAIRFSRWFPQPVIGRESHDV
jgi:hypothetical protein